MVLKCVTKLFPWCGQGIYGGVVFPLDRVFITRSHYMTPVYMSKKKKKTENKKKKKKLAKLLLASISIKTKISPVIFSIRPCLSHQYLRITKYDLRPGKLKQELSGAERIIAILPLAFRYWLSLGLFTTSVWQLNGLRDKGHFSTVSCYSVGRGNWWKHKVEVPRERGCAWEQRC